MSGLNELLGLMARGMENMTTEDQTTRGHKFLSRAFMDGRGGSFTQVYECACGQVYVATCEGRKKPIHMTVIDTDCTAEHAAPEKTTPQSADQTLAERLKSPRPGLSCCGEDGACTGGPTCWHDEPDNIPEDWQ